jgi:hypothetical protein
VHIWPRFGRRELGQAGVLQSKLDVETNSTAELGVLTIVRFQKYHLGMMGIIKVKLFQEAKFFVIIFTYPR